MATIYMPFAELVDIEKELERLNGEKAKMTQGNRKSRKETFK